MYCSAHRQIVYECCQRLKSSYEDSTPKRLKVMCRLDNCNHEVMENSEYCLEHRHQSTPLRTSQKRSLNATQAEKLSAIKQKFSSTKSQSITQPKKVDPRVWKMKVRMNSKPLREIISPSDRIHASVSLSEELDASNCDFYYFSKVSLDLFSQSI